jgi:hypothetical protein
MGLWPSKLLVFKYLELFLGVGGGGTTGLGGSGEGYTDGADILARARKGIEIFFASRADWAI